MWAPVEGLDFSLLAIAPQLVRVGAVVHPEFQISLEGIVVTRHYLEAFVASLLTSLAASENDNPAKAVQDGALAALCGELGKHAKSEGIKAVSKLEIASGTGPKGPRAGLSLDVEAMQKAVSPHLPGRLVTDDSMVYLSAIVEYMAAELLELSGNQTKAGGRKTITDRDVLDAVNADAELRQTGLIVNQAAIARGGVTAGSRGRAAPVVKDPLVAPTRSLSSGDVALARRLNGLTQGQLAKIADFM